MDGHNRRLEETVCWDRKEIRNEESNERGGKELKRKRRSDEFKKKDDVRRCDDARDDRRYWAEQKAKKHQVHQDTYGKELLDTISIDEAPSFKKRKKEKKEKKEKKKKKNKKS